MNDRFYALPEDKQNQILNGAMSVFAQYEYKKATTDDIVARAGISKGLLFHYFGSKKELYLFLAAYAMQYLIAEMRKNYNQQETDFFRMLINAQTTKLAIMRRYPDLLSFLAKSYLETDAAVAPQLGRQYGEVAEQSRNIVLARADASKFKEGVSMRQTLDMILWMSDGLMRSRPKPSMSDLEAINTEYLNCLQLLQQNLYREGV